MRIEGDAKEIVDAIEIAFIDDFNGVISIENGVFHIMTEQDGAFSSAFARAFRTVKLSNVKLDDGDLLLTNEQFKDIKKYFKGHITIDVKDNDAIKIYDDTKELMTYSNTRTINPAKKPTIKNGLVQFNGDPSEIHIVLIKSELEKVTRVMAVTKEDYVKFNFDKDKSMTLESGTFTVKSKRYKERVDVLEYSGPVRNFTLPSIVGSMIKPLRDDLYVHIGTVNDPNAPVVIYQTSDDDEIIIIIAPLVME